MEMKRRITYILMLLLLSLNMMAAKGDFEQLLQQFEKTEQVQDANKLFRLLNDEEFTEKLIQFNDKAPKDSLRQQVWYWSAEYLYDQQQYRRAVEYGEKALPLLKGCQEESDCLNLLAVIFIRLADYTSAAKYAKLCYALDEKSGDPTKMLYSDHFLQLVIVMWFAAYLVIIYV